MVAKVVGWLRKTQQCPFCWAGSDGGMQESLEKMLWSWTSITLLEENVGQEFTRRFCLSAGCVQSPRCSSIERGGAVPQNAHFTGLWQPPSTPATPSALSLPSRSVTKHRVELPMLSSSFPLAIYFAANLNLF